MEGGGEGGWVGGGAGIVADSLEKPYLHPHRPLESERGWTNNITALGQWHKNHGSEDSRFGGSGPSVSRSLECGSLRVSGSSPRHKVERGLVAKPVFPLQQGSLPAQRLPLCDYVFFVLFP